MKSIALALTIAALAAPASAFTQNDSNVTTTSLAQHQVASELGPWSAVLGKGRSQSFRIRQADDDGGSFDDGRHYGNANEDKKGRNVPRRQHGDPGDSGGRGGRVSDPSSGSGDSQKK